MDPVVIDKCSFVYNVCMNNCSVVNLDISGNVSFLSLTNRNACVQNISQNFWIRNTSLNTLNSSVQNFSQNYWITNTSLNTTDACIQNISKSQCVIEFMCSKYLAKLVDHEYFS